MSEDEIGILLFSGLTGLLVWARWYWLALVPSSMISPRRQRWPMTLTPIVAVALLVAVLAAFSSHDVRSDPVYMVFYTVMGAAWTGTACLFLPLLGIDPRGDVVERRNPAARPAVSGAVLGLLLCFAGGNIGDGPGWWVVVFASALATAGWCVVWVLADAFGRVSEHVSVERDTAAGIRAGAMLVAVGLVLGRSVAGTWVSAGATVADFAATGWPALAFAAFEVLVARVPRITALGGPTPVFAFGVLPAAAHLGGAVLYVAGLGWWS